MDNTRNIDVPETNNTASARRSKVSSINPDKRINTQIPHASDIMDLQNQIDEVRKMAIDLYRELDIQALEQRLEKNEENTQRFLQQTAQSLNQDKTELSLRTDQLGRRIEKIENKLDDMYAKNELDLKFQIMDQKIDAKFDTFGQRMENMFLAQTNRQLEEQKQAKKRLAEVHEVSVQYFAYNYYDQPVSAGTGQYLNEVQIETIQLPVKVDADFVCPIYGDSMEPDYKSGDYVFVKLTVELPSGTVGVFDYEGEAYIKQLIIEKDKAYLRSFNKKYKDIPINSDSDFRIIGKVVDVYRGK